MAAVTVRIALRYFAGILVARGLLSADDGSAFSTDPDLRNVEYTEPAFVPAEGWYWLAHRFGWAK